MNSLNGAAMQIHLKRTLELILPERMSSAMTTLWRRYYWWRVAHPSVRAARRAAAKVLASGDPIRLEIGSAPRPELTGWTFLDLNPAADVRHDLRNPLPFPDSSVDEIYSSHALEHFTYPSPLLDLLKECRRVLKAQGRIRVAVPNARLFLHGYFHPEEFDRDGLCTEPVGLPYTSRIDVVNFIAYLGGSHKFMFDEENLPRVLEEAGFRGARVRAFDPQIDLERRRHESVYAEAIR